MAGTAFYYPHIQFRSRKWLRTALLYYDHITRIVPEGVQPDRLERYERFSPDAAALSEEVQELTASGFIRNRAPDKATVSAVADEFLEFAATNLADPKRRQLVLPVLRRHSGWMTVNPLKLDEGLADILREMGLVRGRIHSPFDEGVDDWEMDAAAAVLYLMYLATKMADGRPLVTDNMLYQQLLFKRDAVPIEDAAMPNNSFSLVAAAFEDIIPYDLEDIPLSTLLKFRDKHGPARVKLQEQIDAMAKKIEGATDEEMLRDAVASQALLINGELEVLKAKLSQSNLACGAGLFGMSVPSYLVHIGTGGHSIVAGAVAALVSGTVAKFAFDRRITAGSSPYSYLLDVEHFLSAKSAVQHLISLNLEDPDGYDDRVECCAI